MKTCVVIPTYNERENIVPLVREIFRVAPGASILVVDDESPDGTSQAVLELGKEFPALSLLSRRGGRKGIGTAYVEGFKKILSQPEFDALLMMDADFSHDPSYIPAILAEGETHDLVVGSRYAPGGRTEGWGPKRIAFSACANAYDRFITRIPVKDSTNGFNLIRTDALRKVGVERLGLHGHAFVMQVKYVLWKSGARIAEIPIVFRDRKKGESKITPAIIMEAILAPWRLVFFK